MVWALPENFLPGVRAEIQFHGTRAIREHQEKSRETHQIPSGSLDPSRSEEFDELVVKNQGGREKCGRW